MASALVTRAPTGAVSWTDGVVRIDVHPGGVPALIRPDDPALAGDAEAFIDWFRANKEPLDRLAATHGALKFRGFALATSDHFARAIDHYPTNDLNYIGGATPRGQIAARIYESTAAPKQLDLCLHQEMAYLPKFPRMIAFFSVTSAWAGGETLLADFRELGRRIPRRFWDEVAARGVRYERNFRAPGEMDPTLGVMHKTWPDTFATHDPAEAERACRSVGLDPVWRDDGSLSTLYTARGFIEHPLTGDTIWFNHIASQMMNRQMLGPFFELFHAHYGDGRPRAYHTTYGDGGAIDPADVENLYVVFECITQSFRWHDGDLLLIDNIMTAHGRNAYEGERDLQVALLG
jgi:alpha-ketoglutarate-dependent taurine dioxygenase